MSLERSIIRNLAHALLLTGSNDDAVVVMNKYVFAPSFDWVQLRRTYLELWDESDEILSLVTNPHRRRKPTWTPMVEQYQRFTDLVRSLGGERDLAELIPVGSFRFGTEKVFYVDGLYHLSMYDPKTLVQLVDNTVDDIIRANVDRGYTAIDAENFRNTLRAAMVGSSRSVVLSWMWEQGGRLYFEMTARSEDEPISQIRMSPRENREDGTAVNNWKALVFTMHGSHQTDVHGSFVNMTPEAVVDVFNLRPGFLDHRS